MNGRMRVEVHHPNQAAHLYLFMAIHSLATIRKRHMVPSFSGMSFSMLRREDLPVQCVLNSSIWENRFPRPPSTECSRWIMYSGLKINLKNKGTRVHSSKNGYEAVPTIKIRTVQRLSGDDDPIADLPKECMNNAGTSLLSWCTSLATHEDGGFADVAVSQLLYTYGDWKLSFFLSSEDCYGDGRLYELSLPLPLTHAIVTAWRTGKYKDNGKHMSVQTICPWYDWSSKNYRQIHSM